MGSPGPTNTKCTLGRANVKDWCCNKRNKVIWRLFGWQTGGWFWFLILFGIGVLQRSIVCITRQTERTSRTWRTMRPSPQRAPRTSFHCAANRREQAGSASRVSVYHQAGSTVSLPTALLQRRPNQILRHDCNGRPPPGEGNASCKTLH